MAVEVQELVRLLDSARRGGAKAAEIFLDERSGVDTSVLRGRIGDKVEVAKSSLVVRCWLDEGRMGRATGTPQNMAAVMDSALEKLQSAKPDALGGPIGRLPMTTRGLGIHDRRFTNLEMGDRLDVIVAAERGARMVDRRLLTRDFRYSDRLVRRAYVNSFEVAVEELGTWYQAEGTAFVSRGSATAALSDVIQGRSFASISSLPFGTVLAKRAIELIDAQTLVLEGEIRVLMPPQITAMFFARLAEAFRVQDLQSGKTLFADGFHSRAAIVDTRVHVIDDGRIPGGLRTHFFDDEGVPSVPLALLREGVVDGAYMDVQTARELERAPTGHLWNGKLRPANLMLRSGTRSMSALLSEHDDTRTLVLDAADGLEKLDLATGDFEFRATGMVRKGAQKQGAVLGLPVRGNVLEVLNRVVDVASDTDRVGHVDAPGILLDGMVALIAP